MISRRAPRAPSRKWHVRGADDDVAAKLSAALGLLPVTARVLAGRGVATAEAAEQFLHPGLDGLHSPFLFNRMADAVDRLLFALRHGQRIVVHGDYDVDGISGTVLLVTVLRHLGGDVEFILPHRTEDGYGLGVAGVDRAAVAGARVLIAVDCGITAVAACARAAELGVDVIIVDHHLPGDQLPEVHAIINPRLPDAGYPEDDLAAVGLAFKLARGLLQRHAVTDLSGIAMLKLVALGTVADLVPLRGENRTMTWHGLMGLRDVSNPGLQALLAVAGVDPRRVNAGDIGFRIAPRINAAGRIGHPRDAAELFLTRDPVAARRLAEHLHALNGERQELERRVFEQAMASGFDAEAAIVVAGGEGWHRGVIGIVASRLVEATGRPSLVCSIEGEAVHGSARSVPGFDIVAALRGVADTLEEYGGHRQAAGFHLRRDRFEEFRAALAASVQDIDTELLGRTLECDGELEVDEVVPELVLELERLAPFGIGNPRPRFVFPHAQLAAPPELLKGEHLKLRLRTRGADLEAIAWRRGDLAAELSGRADVAIAGTVKLRHWGGRATLQLEIDDLRVV